MSSHCPTVRELVSSAPLTHPAPVTHTAEFVASGQTKIRKKILTYSDYQKSLEFYTIQCNCTVLPQLSRNVATGAVDATVLTPVNVGYSMQITCPVSAPCYGQVNVDLLNTASRYLQVIRVTAITLFCCVPVGSLVLSKCYK